MNTSDPIMAFRMTSLHEHGHSLGTKYKNTRLPQFDSFYMNMIMWPKFFTIYGCWCAFSKKIQDYDFRIFTVKTRLITKYEENKKKKKKSTTDIIFVVIKISLV